MTAGVGAPSRGVGAGGKLKALSQLLTVPNLGLNLFFVVGFLFVVLRGNPDWRLAALVLLAFLGARNAGHGFNQIVDRELDAQNPRTRDRPLVTGVLSTRAAWAVVLLNVGLFFVAAALINLWLTLLVVPALGLVLGYSYTKRYTPATTVLLGAVQSLIPAAVYLAVDGRMPLPAWVAACAMLLFGTAFESVHSLGDLESDREHGLRSLPLSVGAARVPYLVGGLLAGALALLLAFLWATLGETPWLLPIGVGMGTLVVMEFRGLLRGRERLLRLFRLHFVMGAWFLLGVVLFYISTQI